MWLRAVDVRHHPINPWALVGFKQVGPTVWAIENLGHSNPYIDMIIWSNWNEQWKEAFVALHYTGWVTRILIMAPYNSYTTGYCNLSFKKTKKQPRLLFWPKIHLKKFPPLASPTWSGCFCSFSFGGFLLYISLHVYEGILLGQKNPWKSAICKKNQKGDA